MRNYSKSWKNKNVYFRVSKKSEKMLVAQHQQTVLPRVQISAQKNHNKTKQMTFRKGGKHASRNTMTLYNKPLEVVPKFKYLGVTLQTTLSSFNIHVTERATAAIKAISSNPNKSH